jgi:hypothetical protein
MNPARIVGVIVDSIETLLPQDPAKFPDELRQIASSVSQVMELRAQLPRLVIEDSAIAACQQEIHLTRSGLGPQTQHLHQPCLGAAHAQRIDHLEDFERGPGRHA